MSNSPERIHRRVDETDCPEESPEGGDEEGGQHEVGVLQI